uniref:Uncharacterized protein n=1 Tax=Arundo donax TaxID=35708 RepID=A0A0A9C857_ARUDO
MVPANLASFDSVVAV